MIKINPSSINDLVALKEAGVPVTLTSHPGNASLYKLVLWSCGIPEHLVDVTCCKADSNNWPMHRLIRGKDELLIPERLHREIIETTTPDNRFVTAYQITNDGTRLGRFHSKVMQECFPNVISSCSRLLLSEKEKIGEMFDYLAHNNGGEDIFNRFITPEGIMKPISESGVKIQDMAGSFVGLLNELSDLLFSDKEITTHGGVYYSGVMAMLSGMLVHYWQTGSVERYDISGPDMIHYATQPEHQAQLSKMLGHLRKWNPTLVPKNILVRMLPGTVARIGHFVDHPSEDIVQRRIFALGKSFNSLNKKEKEEIRKKANDDEHCWPTRIQPKITPYFSQHDLISLGKKLIVDKFWMDISLEEIAGIVARANHLLCIANV